MSNTRTLWIGLLLLVSTQSFARDLAYAGVWKGTLGKQPIMVCFEANESSYYYLSHLLGIPLIENDEEVYRDQLDQPDSVALPSEWLESNRDKPTGSWIFSTVAPSKLIGEWRSPSGAPQSIRLERLKLPKDGRRQCASVFDSGSPPSPSKAKRAFNAPRIAAAKSSEQIGHAIAFGGHDYQTVKRIGSTGMRFDASSPHVAMLNRMAEDWLDEQTINAYECAFSYTDWQASFDSHKKFSISDIWERELTPIYWTNHWLSLQDNLPDTFCGGAHGSSDTAYYTINLDTEKPIDLSTWFIGHKKEYPYFPKLIFKLLEAKVAVDDPTADKTCASGFSIQASLDQKGMQFSLSYPHVIRPCDTGYVISYETLLPLMTPQGKAAVKTLLAQ